MMVMAPNIPGPIDIPEQQLIFRPVIIYKEDGSQEKVYIQEQKQNDDSEKALKRHYKITQVYMITSIIAIVITSYMAIMQSRKLKT